VGAVGRTGGRGMLDAQRLHGCPACATSSRSPWLRKGELHLVRCRGCGLVYSDPQPRAVVVKRYRQEYDLAAHFQHFVERKELLYRRRLAWLPKATARFDRLCDVGCGDGQFLALARDAGWRGFGIEPNPPAAARSRSRGFAVEERFIEDATALPWGSFHLVTSWDSLEHTPEPRRFSEQLVRLLAPGGYLALTTLNCRSLVARAFRGRWSMIVEDHFTYWDSASLRALFEGLGLSVVREESYGLERDFVEPVDRLSRLTIPLNRSQPAAAAQPETSPQRVRPWDARRPVAFAEGIANKILDRTSLGVGLALLLRVGEASRVE
jgi:SAM-dependent methyltransferase